MLTQLLALTIALALLFGSYTVGSFLCDANVHALAQQSIKTMIMAVPEEVRPLRCTDSCRRGHVSGFRAFPTLACNVDVTVTARFVLTVMLHRTS
jgi:hypothetical protein